jgi:hypothetical protein
VASQPRQRRGTYSIPSNPIAHDAAGVRSQSAAVRGPAAQAAAQRLASKQHPADPRILSSRRPVDTFRLEHAAITSSPQNGHHRPPVRASRAGQRRKCAGA